MYFIGGLFLALIVILTAIHILVKKALWRYVIIVAISIGLFFTGTMQASFLGLLLISGEVIVNKVISKFKKDTSTEAAE